MIKFEVGIRQLQNKMSMVSQKFLISYDQKARYLESRTCRKNFEVDLYEIIICQKEHLNFSHTRPRFPYQKFSFCFQLL